MTRIVFFLFVMLNGLDASYCYLIVLFVSLSVAELSTIPILTHTLYECGSYCIIFEFEKKEIEIESKKLRLVESIKKFILKYSNVLERFHPFNLFKNQKSRLSFIRERLRFSSVNVFFPSASREKKTVRDKGRRKGKGRREG